MKTRKLGLLLVIFSILVLVVGCATAPAPTSEEAVGIIVESPPALIMGSRFVFQETNLVSGKLTRTFTSVVKEKKEYEGKPTYWVDMTGGKGESFDIYDLNLNWVAFIRGGKEQISASPCIQRFSWPLKVGKRWQTSYDYWDRPRGKRDMGVNYAVLVENYEEVKVPAGTFQAFKIVGEGLTFKEITWYSPAIGMVVKRQIKRTAENVLGYGRWLVELIEYNIPK